MRPRFFRSALAAAGVVATLAIAAVTLAALPSAGAAEGDVGYPGRSYSGAGTEPAGSKPESKLWWNDGTWWSSMWDTGTGDYHIFRLDSATQTWIDTRVPLDTRSNTRADTLWDGTHLYVASHVFNTSTASGYPARLFRFSYDGSQDRYTLDTGFPVTINNYRTETLVIDKDSIGRLWATWVQGTSVYVSHTLGDDRTWATPFVLPVAGATGLKSDDISSLVAFGGSKIGLMWSNQTTATISFAVHLDGLPPAQWQPVETALGGSRMADDHLNLKADEDGRVFAAIRTSQTTSTAPLTMLLARKPAGGWSSHTFGTVADAHGRGIVLVDEGSDRVHMLATAPEGGGTIYEKSSPKDPVSFPPGLGTPFIRNVASATMNNPTSTKQSVDGTSDLAALAGHNSTGLYWHNWLTLPDVEAPQLAAEFVASPTSGFAPLVTQFSDRSRGSPTSWLWDFGDGTTSAEPAPSHSYPRAGTYTVTLTVADDAGRTSTRVRTAYIDSVPLTADFTGTPTSGRVPLTVTFKDATTGTPVRHLWSFGDGTTSEERNPTHTYPFAGTYTVELTAWDAAGNASTKTRTNYVTALPLTAEFTGSPTSGGEPLVVKFTDATLGTPTRWLWDFGDGTTSEERSPTHTYPTAGTYSVTLTVWDAAGNTSTKTRSGYITVHPLTADFVATPKEGPAPLLVSFTDRSFGVPTSWLWNFGDGQTSTERDPTHTYKRPGSYSVTLTVSDAKGDTSTKTAPDYIVASADTTVTPSGDAYVRSAYPTKNFGTATTLRVKNGGTGEHYRSFMKFTVPQLAGPVIAAKLRLHVADSSTSGGDIYGVDPGWTETSVTWSNAPPMSGEPLARIGNAPLSTWLDVALPATLFSASGGTYAFGIQQPIAASDVWYGSREATNKPQLILTVDFGPDNSPPVLAPDTAAPDEDGEAIVDVLANDAPGPPEDAGQTLVVDAITAGPRHGAAEVTADGRIRYVPAPDYNGADALTYRACDDGDGRLCGTTTLDLAVSSINDTPRAGDDTASLAEDGSQLVDVLANDAPGPANEAAERLTLALTDLPRHGTATIAGGGIAYTPAADYYGADALSYRVCDDGSPVLCATATVAVSVAAVNDAPRATADAATTAEDEPAVVDVLLNDSPGPANEGQTLVVDSITGAPQHGAADVTPDGRIRYVPAPDENGKDQLAYRACDNGEVRLCATATLDLTVSPVNDAPRAGDDTASVAEDGSLTVAALANDTAGPANEGGQLLTLVGLTEGPGHGSAAIESGGILYTPAPDYYGADAVTYRICDDGSPALCATATVRLSVTAVNDAPQARPDAATTAEDVPALVDVLANDSAGAANEASQALSVEITSSPLHGSASLEPDGTVRYVGGRDFHGSDRFEYRVCDDATPALCASAAVAVDVAAVNDAPAAGPDKVTLVEDSSALFTVLENDGAGAADESGQTLTVAGIDRAPEHGVVEVDVAGILYVPNPDHSGSDSFGYRVCDDGAPAACSTGEVRLTITGVNDLPRAADDLTSAVAGEDHVFDVLANDAGGPPGEEESQAIELRAITIAPAHGTAEHLGGGLVRYRRSTRYYESDSFVYQVCEQEAPSFCVTARASVETSVAPSAETDPVPTAGDAADDAAIWVDAVTPERSAVIGTDKQGGGLGVYDLAGAQLHFHAGGRMNGVDLRSGWELGGETATIVAASERGSGIAVFRFDPRTRSLSRAAARELETGWSPYGLCMYRSAATGKLYAFVTRRYELSIPPETHDVEQWELFDDGSGKVDARLVRTLRVGSQSEGCVADDELGTLYIAEEKGGIWRYDAEPGAGSERLLVDAAGASGQLAADVEGLALAYGAGGTGYLLASSQGDDTFAVYRREGDNDHVRNVSVGGGGGIDGAEESDGIDVTTASLGSAFPNGLLVVHDGRHGAENQNYKLVGLEHVVGEEPADAGCTRPYSAESPWNTAIGASPAYDPQSTFYLDSVTGTLTSSPAEYTFPVYEVSAATALETVPVSGWFSQVSEGGSLLTNQRGGTAPLPIPPGAGPAAGGDAQIVLVDPATGNEWGASSLERDPLGGGWTAWNAYLYNTAWDAVPPHDASDRPFFPRGAGVPYLAGLVRPCEIARGRIDHALAFAYNYPTDAYVYPATKSDGVGLDPNDLPEGARLQLDPSLSEAEIRSWGCTGPCLVVAKAMQEYGMYLIDNSGRPKVMFEYEGTAEWGDRIGSRTVSAIPLSALKLLELGPVIPD